MFAQGGCLFLSGGCTRLSLVVECHTYTHDLIREPTRQTNEQQRDPQFFVYNLNLKI